MKIRAKIIGAGSIGNHLAQASRRAGWDVVVVDNDVEALWRMREEIYPTRYGEWDDTIALYKSCDEPIGGFDVIFIGTPPDSHLPIAIRVLEKEAPRVLQIEKPLCTPTLTHVPEFLGEVERHPNTKIVVGYDFVLGKNTDIVERYIGISGNLNPKGRLGSLITLDVNMRFNWQPILVAHPWLSGPQDTYLGSWALGGGAGGEHSHGLHLWQHFARFVGAGRVTEVSAVLDYVKDTLVNYDQLCFMTLTTENGLKGRVVQDVVTYPEDKKATLQFENGRIEWHLGIGKDLDRVLFFDKDGAIVCQEDISKKRPDDFWREIRHIDKLLTGKVLLENSPINLSRGLDTICVLEAAHRSHREKRTIKVEYPYWNTP